MKKRMVGSFTAPEGSAMPKDCKVCCDADWGTILVGDICVECLVEKLTALREAGEKMAKIYTHLPKEIRNESNVYYQILLSGVEAMELMTALEAWEAAKK